MKILKQLCYLFPSKQRWAFFGLFFLQLIETCLDFFGISLILPFVNIIINADSLQGSGWFTLVEGILGTADTRTVLLFITFLLIGIYLFKNLYSLFLMNLRIKFINTNMVKMSVKMIICYMHKPYTFHLQRNTAEIIRNVNGDVNGAFGVISNLFTLVADVLIVVALAIYLFAVDVMLTLGILVALGICSGVYFLVVRTKVRNTGAQSREIAARRYKAVHQALGGIKEVKVMNKESYFSKEFRDIGVESVEIGRRYKLISAIPGRLLETLCMGTILGVLAVKILTGADLASVVPGLSAFAVAAIRLMPKANGINACINHITYHLPSLDALCQDLKESDEEEKARLAELEEKRKQQHKISYGQEKDIFVRDVTFTYPNKNAPVLEHVNLTIRHGQTVGIVGTTGAGKTTLVDLILGLLHPDSGSICYGEQDIQLDYTAWLKHLGYIPQNIYLVDDTIRRNIALGVEDDAIDEKAVWRALEDAQLADFVRSLEEGLDTVIGERGVRISGGQRQRIGIARALYYDPEILFFDEATSSLDNETESALMESVNKLGSQKTMIIVAHRLTTLRGCDKIYKVEDGGVTETELEL
ncbi:MAG: ABC transporter ATP-binding protein [Oscillospiraceae bacterium]|nr:ABC transporter ATP-binding protein [Oscillospiraceae bacterium]